MNEPVGCFGSFGRLSRRGDGGVLRRARRCLVGRIASQGWGAWRLARAPRFLHPTHACAFPLRPPSRPTLVWADLLRANHCDAQCSTIEIIWVVLVIAAAILGGWALFSAPVLRWFLLSAGLFSALGAMAVGINAEWLSALDVSVEGWFEAHRSRRGRVEARGIFRFVGEPVYVAGAAAVSGTLLSWGRRSAVPAVLVVGGVGFGVVLEQVLKVVVARTSTPSFEHSFPSGHVMGSVVLLGMVAVCFGIGRSRAVLVALAVLVVAGVLFVAFITLYVPFHTFTDVIGGLFLGGAIVSLGAAVLNCTHYSRRDSAAAPTDDPSPSYTCLQAPRRRGKSFSVLLRTNL